MYQTPFTLLEFSSIPLPMNTLTLARRAAVVRCLIDGASIRATARMTQTDKDTVSKILIEVGSFASEYQNLVLTNLSCRRIEADEIWAFVGAKAGNAITAEQCDIWIYTGLCADTKLIDSWMVGSRSAETTHRFMQEMAGRLVTAHLVVHRCAVILPPRRRTGVRLERVRLRDHH